MSKVEFGEPVFGREVAMIGGVIVGEVALHHGGEKVKAYARVYLPGAARDLLPAGSMERAKEIMQRVVDDWLERAGLEKRR